MFSHSESLLSSSVWGQEVVQPEPLSNVRPHILILKSPGSEGIERGGVHIRSMISSHAKTILCWSLACPTSYHLDQLLQKGDQLQQLIVILVHEPTLYGNPIGQLSGEKKVIHNRTRKHLCIIHTLQISLFSVTRESSSKILFRIDTNSNTYIENGSTYFSICLLSKTLLTGFSVPFWRVHLICKGLRWIVDDDGLWQISAQDVEVLDVIPLDADTMLTKQPVSTVTVQSEGREKKKINQWQGPAINYSEKPQHWHLDSSATLTPAFSAPSLFPFMLASASECVVLH